MLLVHVLILIFYVVLGLFVYSSGSIIVLEDLSTGKQEHLLGEYNSPVTLWRVLQPTDKMVVVEIFFACSKPFDDFQ